MALTQQDIRKLKPRSGQYEVMDPAHPGFGIKVHPSGQKSWIYRYRFAGRLRRITLGEWTWQVGAGLSRDQAMALYLKHRGRHRDGVDPLVAEREERDAVLMEENKRKAAQRREASLKAFTVSALVEFYAEHHEKRSLEEDLRMLRKDVLPVIGDRPAEGITPDDVQLLIDDVVRRGAPRAAALTLAAFRKAYAVAKRRRRVARNPCADIDAPKQGERDRHLTRTELGVFFERLHSIPSTSVRNVLELVLLTACRKGEACAVAWSEIDFDELVWTIPAEKSKNGRQHRVMLSVQTAALLENRRKAHGASAYVFPSRAGTKQPYLRGDAINEAVGKYQTAFGLKHWTPHDLRRTAVTHLSRMGCPRLHQNRITNHYERSVAAIYDRHEFDSEARQWLQTLADFLDELK